MNKNFCLLVFMCLVAFGVATSVEAPQVQGTVLGWWMNTLDGFLAFQTVTYCFLVGWFNIYSFNDGGLMLYTCMNSYLATITFG